jgi:hypothetical protein
MQVYHTLATGSYASKEQAFLKPTVAPEVITAYPYKGRNRHDEDACRTSALGLIRVAKFCLLPLAGRPSPDCLSEASWQCNYC